MPLADFDSVEKKTKSEKIMTHLLKMPYRYHLSYALKYLGCEILALVALVSDIYDSLQSPALTFLGFVSRLPICTW